MYYLPWHQIIVYIFRTVGYSIDHLQETSDNLNQVDVKSLCKILHDKIVNKL